jgi:hypothetical protein
VLVTDPTAPGPLNLFPYLGEGQVVQDGESGCPEAGLVAALCWIGTNGRKSKS